MANARQLELGAVLGGAGNDQFGWRDRWAAMNKTQTAESRFD